MKNFEKELIKNEPPVKAENLLEEIKPLLNDYFVGDKSFNGNNLSYLLPNGQKFILTVKQSL